MLKWVVGFNGFILCYLCGALKVGKAGEELSWCLGFVILGLSVERPFVAKR